MPESATEPREPDPATARTIARHPRPLGGDPLRVEGRPLVSLTGLVLNNGEIPHQLATERKPPWLKARVPGGPGYQRLRAIMDEHKLHTVCEEAGCPNMGECWARGVATIMILGDTCTRACGFCNVKTGRPASLDRDEPRRVAESLALMGLKHVVITSVNRDELSDGGAAVWAETILRTRETCPNMSIEVLIPDFEGNWAALQMVIDAKPHIINHNLETVRRMYPAVRPSAKFDRSLELLRRVKEQGGVAKTGIMVGIGERDEEVVELMGEVQRATKVSRCQGVEVSRADSTCGALDTSTPRHLDTTGESGVPRCQGVKVPRADSTCGALDTSTPRHLDTTGESGVPRCQGVKVPRADSTCGALDTSTPRHLDTSSCDILTIGQYLQPTRNHLPIDRWVTPEQFAAFKAEGLRLGFKVVESGPLVRSSYHADHQADVLTEVLR